MRLRRVVILGGGGLIALISASGLYIGSLYSQLRTAFLQQDQFIPTRIYSDVSRIAPAQTRKHVEERLQSLAYTAQMPSGDREHLTFTLRVPDYPSYLIPEGHPVLTAGGQTISLHFEDASKDALLQSIELEGKEIPDLYLEPEFVATLSQGGLTEGKKHIRSYVKFEDFPPLVWRAIIAVEDQHFMEHAGLDPRGLARAIWVNLKTMSFAQGGSTLTLQLVKNLMARKKKNIFKKAPEIVLALMLEASFEKEQILERYLNEVNLGQIGNLEVHGVAEGAELFFGKKLNELNLGEIALMAGLIRGPGYYSPYQHRDRAFERQRWVLKKMAETGHIAEAEAQLAEKLPVRLAPQIKAANKAPYFADFVKAELIRQIKDRIAEAEIPQASLRVYTTLDIPMNAAAQHSVNQGVMDLESKLKLNPQKERLEGALASVDPSNGFVRALIGGRSYSQSTFNRILNMKRQVGSTFKPIVYLAAILKGEDADGVPYGPGHPAEDAPWTLKFDKGRQTWTPRNYEKEYLGWTSYRTALAHSVNTIAARVGLEAGLDRVITTARALSIQSELPEVPSLSLGIAELSPVDLLRAYAILANHGIQDELTVIRAITQDDGSAFARFVYNPRQVVDRGAADLVTDMMTSVFSEGTARGAASMGFDRPAAGKTGTTSHHRDAWFAGYTPQLTTVVWVGMDQTPAPASKDDKSKKPTKISLTGGTSALPIWVNFMKAALTGEPPQNFPVSPEISDITIDRHTGKRALGNCPMDQVITEKYLRSHEPRDSSCEKGWPESRKDTEI